MSLTEPIGVTRAPNLEKHWRVSAIWPGAESKMEWPRLYSLDEAEGVISGLKFRFPDPGIKWYLRRYEYFVHIFEEG